MSEGAARALSELVAVGAGPQPGVGTPALPAYDRGAVRVGIVHFGVGGFHRAHEAMFMDRLLTLGGAAEWGICGVGLLPGDARMRDVMQEQQGLYTLVLRHPDGAEEARVIGSIVEYLFAPDDPGAVLRRLASPDVRIVSLTITEGGYNTSDVDGRFDASNPGVLADLANPSSPTTVFGFIVEALRLRREAGVAPFTVMSCDNIQANGSVAREAIVAFAALRDAGLAEWIGEHVHFPSSMVDRITPATTPEDVRDISARHGVADAWPVVAEPFAQWVLEDRFTAGRPEFERVGVQLVDDVMPYELMKLRLLNGAHQAIAYPGLLMGFRLVHEAAADPLLARFVRAYMDEVTPSLLPVPGIDLEGYKDGLIQRFGNAGVRDTLERLAAETSDRIPKFVLPVLSDSGKRRLPLIAAVVACWARYARGLDDAGGPLAPVDRDLDRVREAAFALDADPLAFLELTDYFGGAAADERFSADFIAAWALLDETGTRGMLAEFLERRAA